MNHSNNARGAARNAWVELQEQDAQVTLLWARSGVTEAQVRLARRMSDSQRAEIARIAPELVDELPRADTTRHDPRPNTLLRA